MGVVKLCVLVVAALAVKNELFREWPYVASADAAHVRLAYALGETIVKIVVRTETEKFDLTKNQTNRIGNYYYGSATFSTSPGYLNWTLEDFGGQTSKCSSRLVPIAASVDSGSTDACAATGCYESFRDDGWCDASCLSPVCGYDGSDCEYADVFRVLKCDPRSIADGVCDSECNSPLTFYDGGDCNSPCMLTGCPRFSLGNGICDKLCNNEACQHDRGDCPFGSCAPGCGTSSLGNGQCDQVCDTPACDFDHGDCTSQVQQCSGSGTAFFDHRCIPLTCSSLGCTDSMIGNDACDQQCNNPACWYDGGDCMKNHTCHNHGCTLDDVGDRDCDMDCFYNECAYDLGDCDKEKAVCWTGCMSRFIGNGVCDEQCNVPQCQFDGGDCAVTRCSEACFPEWLGDGICDQPCNIPNCQNDRGDCVSSTSAVSVSDGEVTISGVRYRVATDCVRSAAAALVAAAFFSFS